MATPEEIAEENKKIRFLRLLVDFSMQFILQGDLPFEEALHNRPRPLPPRQKPE